MTLERLAPIRPFLLASAIFGFLVINGPFLYFALVDLETYSEGMGNAMTRVFLGEAFLLMFLFAYLIARMGWKRPGWVFFIFMSLIGSLAFSIPLQLFLLSSPKRGEQHNGE